MLSESVLAELVLDTPLRESLITLAWPSLDTAGRMQVIQAIYEQFPADPSCPSWLATLAMKDAQPIVRYWAAKRTYFSSSRTPDAPEWMRTTDEELYLFADAASDTSEFIRFFATKKIHEISGYDLTPLSQLERLLFIRNIRTPDLEDFIDWLGKAVESGTSEIELIDCCVEFFRNPKVVADMNRLNWIREDGYQSYKDGKGMDKGWLLVKQTGPRLAYYLASQLPTQLADNRKSFDASDLIGISKEALEALLWRQWRSNEISELCEKIRKQPSEFSVDVVAALERVEELGAYGQVKQDESKEDELNRAATERSRAIHEDVIDLKQRVAEMREMLQDLGAAQSRKRGLFG